MKIIKMLEKFLPIVTMMSLIMALVYMCGMDGIETTFLFLVALFTCSGFLYVFLNYLENK